MKKVLYVILLTAVAIACKNEQSQENKDVPDGELYEQVAQASGINQWEDVEIAKFTFNVERNGETVVSRNWEWKPKTGDITLNVQDTSITFNRNQKLDSLSIGNDRSFINDIYWLLPQFKLVWDQGTQITYPENGEEQIVRITYTGNDGYTPGDQYDMVIDNDMMVSSWKYYPKGATQAAMETTFESYEDYSGIKIATDHRTPDGATRIYFTDIEIVKE